MKEMEVESVKKRNGKEVLKGWDRKKKENKKEKDGNRKDRKEKVRIGDE